MVYAFTGGDDGSEPEGLTIDPATGILYGVTSAGALGYGTLFSVTVN